VILPRALPEHGTIGICSPAGPVKRERLERAIKQIEKTGYRVKLSPSVFGEHGFFSADDETRIRELHDCFRDPEIDAVFCSRGGTGTGRLLERIKANLIASSRKPFLGFSDTTVLQWMIFAQTGFVTYSGPLAVEWDDSLSETTRIQAWNVLGRRESGNLVDSFRDSGFNRFELLRGHGQVEGCLMPGNLAMVTTLLGTPYFPDMSGKILMIEDVSEAPYRFDRMLFHLRNAGVLQRLAGLIVGDFGWSGEEGEFESQRQSLLDATRGMDYPIMINLPYGHGRERMTLPVGGPVRADFSDSPGIYLLVEQSV
jgi:muramoyltetrapeptide carboxypeptidase